MTEFQRSILAIVRTVPRGKVVSYGQIATYLGSPRAARQVGWAMRSLEGAPDFPWWRVLNNQGLITIKGTQHASKVLQKELLESEGVEIGPDFRLDMKQYRHHLT